MHFRVQTDEMNYGLGMVVRAIAPRPVNSALDLSKLESAGFHMPDWEDELREYLKTR